MLLRNLSQSLRGHDWFTSVAEFVLLILGIFLGFQLDRWNGERLEQKEAVEYGVQMLDDLQISRREMLFRADYYQAVEAYGAVALTAWDEAPAYPAPEVVVAFYQASNILPASNVRGAYDALAAKGLAVLLDGPAFASRLAAFHAQSLEETLNVQTPYRMEVRGVLPVDVQDAVREHCTRLQPEGGLMQEKLLPDCDIGLPAARAERILQDLRQHPRLGFYLRQSMSNNAVLSRVLRSKVSDVVALEGALREILERRTRAALD